MNTTTNVKTENRGRKFQVAKFVMSRAWDIAKNAAVFHNTDADKVLKDGLVRASDFFHCSLAIAWSEAKAKIAKVDFNSYKMHSTPKKNASKILDSIANFGIVNGIVSTKPNDTTNDIINKMKNKVLNDNVKLLLKNIILQTRYASKNKNQKYNPLQQQELFI